MARRYVDEAVDFRQVRLSEWTMTDASGVVSSVTDGDGYTDIAVTGTTGDVYFTRKLSDFSEVSISGTDVVSIATLIQMVSGEGTSDQIGCGVSDDADPTAAGALWHVHGIRYNGATYDIVCQSESVFLTTSGLTIDRVLGDVQVAIGRSAPTEFAQGFNGASTWAGNRSINLNRAFTPTHLLVKLKINDATTTTIRVSPSFRIHEPITRLAVATTPTDTYGRVWFYPDDAGTLEEVIVQCWSSLDESPMVSRRSARTYSGKRADVISGGNFQVRAVLEQFKDDSTLRGLFGAQNQLYRGRTVSICADVSKAWAGFAAFPPRRGDTTVRIQGTGNTFTGSGSLAVGDHVIIQTIDDDPITELVIVTAVPANNRFTCAGVMNSFPRDVPVLVRHRYYWPALWLDESQQGSELLTTDHGLNYTFDAMLTEDLGFLQSAAGLGATGTLGGTVPSPGSGGRTFATLSGTTGQNILGRITGKVSR